MNLDSPQTRSAKHLALIQRIYFPSIVDSIPSGAVSVDRLTHHLPPASPAVASTRPASTHDPHESISPIVSPNAPAVARSPSQSQSPYFFSSSSSSPSHSSFHTLFTQTRIPRLRWQSLPLSLKDTRSHHHYTKYTQARRITHTL